MGNVRRNPPDARALGHDTAREFDRLRTDVSTAGTTATLYERWAYSFAGTGLRYIPWPPRLAEATAPDFATIYLVGFNATITRIALYSNAAMGKTTIEIRDASTENALDGDSKAVETVSANEFTFFDFNVNVSADDEIAVAITPASAGNDQGGYMKLDPR